MANDHELLIKVKAETDKAIKEIDKLNKEISKLSKQSKISPAAAKSFDGIAKSAKSLNSQLKTLAATYLSFQGAKALVTSAAEIEDGFIGIAKTTGLTGDAMEDLKQKILDLGSNMAGIKTTELQQIAETAGQLGIQGSENILKFTEVVAKIGATTELSASEAATAMAKLGNSMKVPVKDFDRLGSVINELSNTTTATAGDLVNMGQRISGVGKTFGLTADQVLALSATLTDVGMSAELGGTAVSKIMMSMLQDTEKFAKASGMSFEDFSAMIKKKPVKALEAFLTAIGKLDKAAQVQALKDLGLSASGTAQAVLKLSGNTDILSKNLQTAAGEWKNNTSLQKEYSTASEGFNAQLTKLANKFTELTSKIGDALLPKLKDLVEEFGKWMDSLSQDQIQQFADQLSQVIGAIGEMAISVGKIVGNIALWMSDNADLVKAIAGLYIAVKALKGITGLLGASFVVAGGKSTVFEGALSGLTKGGGALLRALKLVAGFAGPWGLALAAMGGAAVAAMNKYEEAAKKAIEVNKQVATSLDKYAAGMDIISNKMAKANEEQKQNGAVTKQTFDEVERALRNEIDGIEAQIAAWEKSGIQTEEQRQAYIQLGKQLGTLKGELDILDAVYTIDLEAETNGADKDIEKIKKDTETLDKKKVDVDIDADTSAAEGSIDDLKSKTEDLSSTYTVDADTSAADSTIERSKSEAQKPVSTEVDFKPVTAANNAARQKAAAPIYVPVYYVPKNSPNGHAMGGYVPRLASGGTFTGSGRVPGYDPTDSDKVNARLTGGEFVINRSAVQKIGLGLLERLNSLGHRAVSPVRTPRLPGYAAGGSTGSSSMTIDGNVDVKSLGRLTLDIGGQSVDAYVPERVAAALTQYIETQGGI